MKCRRLLETTYADEKIGSDHHVCEDMDLVLLVAGWFKRHPEELGRTLPLETVGSLQQGVRRRRDIAWP
jgi:hypothetical protein